MGPLKLDSSQFEAVLDRIMMLPLCKEQHHQQTFELSCKEDNGGCHLCKVKTTEEQAQILEEFLITQGAIQKSHHL